ncbi:helix-turn-helix transcriptional regulator [Olivibacter sp. SDN3]|uniref:AraC family transcriptional regulator n=1 Tax=Olivibacter sp. SDN3 TaxID=2764720 RepID=UPI001650E022|nr:AraC family transcriptional regulator [Olivibacter sp. SDN3]QNL51497.1 helix-turn-helix transcriptional regulator [Olivibacter sp. SDN3]
MNEKYYIVDVDRKQETIYCYHNQMGEKLIPSHSHKKGQFLYTEGGVVFVKTMEKSYFLPARHYMWIAPGVEHSIHPSSPQVIMRNLYFPIYPEEDAFYFNTSIHPVNDLLLELMLFTNRWNGHIEPSDKSSFTIVEAIKMLLPQVSNFSLPLELPLAKDKRLKALVAYLEENLSKDILFNEIASLFGFSPRSLSRLFQKDLGMSFIQYLTALRMLKALQYLLEKSLTVNEVALQVGYNSLPTFSNTFQKLIGVRPSEYVKMNTPGLHNS